MKEAFVESFPEKRDGKYVPMLPWVLDLTGPRTAVRDSDGTMICVAWNEHAEVIAESVNSAPSLMLSLVRASKCELAVRKENSDLRTALKDIMEWCENAKKLAGVEPYGLEVARKALAKVIT